MDSLQIIILLMVGLAGWGVVTTRSPLKQSLATSLFGMLLGIFFLILQSPDVALSEICIGGAVFPLMVVLAVAKTSAKGAE